MMSNALAPGLLRARSEVVAIVEHLGAGLLHREHRLDLDAHPLLGALDVRLRIARAELGRFGEREALRHVADERIVRSGLLGDEIGDDAAAHELGVDVGRVRAHRDRDRLIARGALTHAGERSVEIVDALVDVLGREALLDARGIDLDAEAREARHRRGERLRAAHAAEARGEHPLPGGPARALGVRLARGDERFERALHDALRADVDPRARGHLPIHGEAERLEPAELVERREAADEVRVREQDPRRVGVRAELADGLAALDQQRLVVLELLELTHDDVERGPRSRGLARAAVHDEIVRALRDVGIEVVVQHAERRLLHPHPLHRNVVPRGARTGRGPLPPCPAWS